MTNKPDLTERIVSSQEELDAAWVGGPSLPSGPIVVADYDPAWTELYEREAARIRDLLGATLMSIEHVGSTSVPGLAAKPVIDINLVVPDSADETAYLLQLQSADYRLIVREPNWHEHRLFKGPDTNINLHVFSPGCPEVIRMRVLRDWLRKHRDDRDLYARTKKSLADGRLDDIRVYTTAKDAIIDEIYGRALPHYLGSA